MFEHSRWSPAICNELRLLLSFALAAPSLLSSCSHGSGAKSYDAGADASALSRSDAALTDASPSGRDGALAANDASADAGVTSPRDASSGRDGGTPPDSLRAEVCGAATSFPHPLPPENMRKAQRVGTQSFGFLEGPVWLADQGVLLFSDMDFSGDPTHGPPSRIWRLTPPASFELFAASANSNGLALLRSGEVLAATHDNQGLSRFDPESAARTPLDLRAAGKRLNSPNDLVVRSDGKIYLTDPDWQLGPRANETGITGVYRVDALAQGASEAVLVEGSLDKPNGIALSPDERTLYLGSNGNEIWQYDVAADGSLQNRRKFADTGPSDGMTVDCAGNLYVTSGTVEVFAPDGHKLGDITLDGNPSNVAFGGPDRKTLYITAGPRLYAIELNVPGFPY